MSKDITILSYRLSSFTLYRSAQIKNIPDRASVHAKKGDFGQKKEKLQRADL